MLLKDRLINCENIVKILWPNGRCLKVVTPNSEI